ncbi:MAG: TlpA family protein disulfide reductase [Ignavibacteriales bacterium]|nr:MAG: TlpA family protein disulfide reductase [Ignavibacteriales bacterium]
MDKTIINIFIIVLVIGCVLHAQIVDLIIKGSNTVNAKLYSMQGEKTFFVDSIKSTTKDQFNYSFDPTKHHSGIYRLSLSNNKWIDFVYDNEEINIKTTANNIFDSLVINRSESNKLFYSFIKLNKAYKTKTELLQLILARYPKDDNYYKTTQQKLVQLQKEYLEFVNNESQKNTASFIAKYIKSSQLPVVDITLPVDKQLASLKSRSLDKVDFNNAELIYSDAFTNKTIEYLTYYRNPQLPKELLEKEFMVAVDTILNKAKVHQLVYQHIVDYLIDGFKKFGFDKIIDYIVDNYVIKDDLCLDEKTEGMIQKRIDQAKYFKIGSTVPDIILPDSSDNLITLNEIKTDKTLVIFYASWCPHCKETLPQIFALYKKQIEKKFEVYAISLDNKRKDWLSFINANCPNWINVCDLKGWDGKAANDYYIYATPTMFLLDKDKKILAKPTVFEEVKRALAQ